MKMLAVSVCSAVLRAAAVWAVLLPFADLFGSQKTKLKICILQKAQQAFIKIPNNHLKSQAIKIIAPFVCNSDRIGEMVIPWFV